mmetsp:Transcript_26209/g.60716  ORF Transcript_26209/g.60716 Transcript_26209/m.60716 type:complete len:278 (+) Transcript_26209:506-1339(+)
MHPSADVNASLSSRGHDLNVADERTVSPQHVEVDYGPLHQPSFFIGASVTAIHSDHRCPISVSQPREQAVQLRCKGTRVLLYSHHTSHALQRLEAVLQGSDAQKGQSAILKPLSDAPLEDLQVVGVGAPGSSKGDGAASPVMLLELKGCLLADDQRPDAGRITEKLVERERHEVGSSFRQIQRMAGSKLCCIKQDSPGPQPAFARPDLRGPAQREDLAGEVLFGRIGEQRERPSCVLIGAGRQLIQPGVHVLVPSNGDRGIHVPGHVPDTKNRVVVL